MIRGYAILTGALLCACAAPEPPPVAEVDPAASVSAVPSPPAAPAQGAATVPVGVDTAGLGARIATAFPSWRLSTEREIADRFRAANDDFQPEQMWQPSSFGFQGKWMGSGQLWWVWPGDYDRDGSQDFLTILSNRADPAEGKVVVLHADGTTADFGDDSDGIAAFPGEDGKAQMVWLIWEKTGGTIVWDPATKQYSSVEPERECC